MIRKFFLRKQIGDKSAHKAHFDSSIKTIVITCDEVSHFPDLLSKPGLGQIKIIKTPANTVNVDDLSSFELKAINELLVEQLVSSVNVIVRAHTHCSYLPLLAMHTPSEGCPEWIRRSSKTKRFMDSKCSGLPTEQMLALGLQCNVVEQLNNLKRAPFVCQAIHDKRLQLLGWIYDSEFDWISLFDPETELFLPPNAHSFGGGADTLLELDRY